MIRAKIRLPAKMQPLAGIWKRPDIRHAAIYGGRGSGKSHTVATILLLRALQHPERILCFREIQRSIKDSVHRLLSDKITAYRWNDFFEVTKTEIRGKNGSLFLFAGLRDHTADSIKSYEGLTIAWGEEAHSITEESAIKLIPTVRGCDDPKIIWTWNPESEEDYVHKRFVVRGDPSALTIKANWRDNPWFPAALDAERKTLLAINQALHDHVWEGECRTEHGLMFKRDWFRWYDDVPERLHIYMASDYAVTQDGGDWTEHGVWGIDPNGDLYALDWWSGQTDPDTWIKAAFALLRRYKPLAWYEEKGVILRAVDAAISKAMQHEARSGRPIYTRRIPLASAGNKASRAMGFAARASAGTVWLPRGVAWAERLVNQLCAFSGQPGRTDDMVDVCSLVGRGIDTMVEALAAPPPKAPAPPELSPAWFEALDRQEASERAARAAYYS